MLAPQRASVNCADSNLDGRAVAMQLQDKVIVVTGAAGGIGRALAIRFAAERPKALVVCDVPAATERVRELARQLEAGGTPSLGLDCDVADEARVKSLVAECERAYGRVDVFCSNAGVIRDGDETTPDADWTLNWDVHLMAHVYAARAVLPGMRARGEGYLMNTASAAGLLTSLPSASYAVTKHAAIAFAEWLSVKYGAQGIRVSVLCPQAVDTAMIARPGGGSSAARNDGVLSPEQCAESVVRAMDDERFLILPHPQVIDYARRKLQDYDRWLGGMRRFAAGLVGKS